MWIIVEIGPRAGRTISLDVAPDESVERLKAMIRNCEGIPVEQQNLTFIGRQLEDGRALSDYNVRTGSRLLLTLRSHGGMQVFVKVPSGRTLTLEVEESSMIGHVKAMIEKLEGIPAGQQRLIFAAKELDDARTVSDYDLHSLLRPLYLVKRQGQAVRPVAFRGGA
eukprot:CAMPEP_0179104970 /NCGR_PEP_ID=MMETSP0796-20121207/48727_1 /TAXON_ID=73915 /ORGANISM="Pyrodinium bahamense, Strain pbaha01" /LENGTH=165 /DNA_ID=CAMNT_0020802943 /DNA_START=88 /DNA_END=585 /DNA_ORIENTATION=-